MRFLVLLLALIPPLALADKEKEPISVVQFFVATDCPIANSYAPEFGRIFKEYTTKDIKFQLVYPEASLTDSDTRKHTEEYGLEIEPVIDRTHALVTAAGATTTPEVAIFDGSGTLVYRGLINNLYTDYGDRRRQASEHYVRDVLDALIAGKSVTFSETKAIGCLIEPLPEKD